MSAAGFVLGSEQTDDDHSLDVIGLAAGSGAQRWALPLPPQSSVDVRSLGYNGRYVVLTELSRDSLVAIDPSTGDVAWRRAH